MLPNEKRSSSFALASPLVSGLLGAIFADPSDSGMGSIAFSLSAALASSFILPKPTRGENDESFLLDATAFAPLLSLAVFDFASHTSFKKRITSWWFTP